jgi:predicted dehydrogenase/flavin reductase (DIM6/NTAB) family NADH-FMN oxidoreductase RutF
MILTNENIWNTRIQSVGFLLTAKHEEKIEVYYAAIICQVSVDEVYLSISVNPDFPICDLIEKSGKVGINQLYANQSFLVAQCVALPIDSKDKITKLNLEHEVAHHDIPLLVDCMQSLECIVHKTYIGSADHKLFICKVMSRKIRNHWHNETQLYQHSPNPSAIHIIKNFICQTPLYGVLARLRQYVKPPLNIEEGTRIALSVDSKSKLGICLVGCGWWGKVHAHALKQLSDRVQRYFVSRNLKNSELFAKRFLGAGIFSSLAEALASDKVNAVILCLPHHQHAGAALAALNAGKHVLIEKPIALNLEECENLISIAEQNNLTFAVAEQYRVSPMIKVVNSYIKNEVIGQVHTVRVTVAGLFRPQQNWKLKQEEMGGGILLDVGIHYVSVLRMLFGNITHISAIKSKGGFSGLADEDTVTLQLGFNAGIIADIFLSWSCYRDASRNEIEILGNKGSLSFSLSSDKLTCVKPLSNTHWISRLRQAVPWRLHNLIHRFLPTQEIKQVNTKLFHKNLHQLLLEEFIYCIENNVSSTISAKEGAEDLRVILQAYHCMQQLL